MSKMFDSLRRAEEARRRKQTANEAEPGKPTIEPVSAPVVAAPMRTADVSRLDGFPDSLLVEMGVLKNSLESIAGREAKRVLLFVSSNRKEGTTTIVSSFAKILSLQEPGGILLIEMNARSPSLKRKFGLESDLGVTDFFSGEKKLEEITQRTSQGSFDVVHIGESNPVKLQLHMEKTFPLLVDAASKLYKTILIDAPPVIGSPETPPMAAATDGVVLVVRSEKTKREIVQRSMNIITQLDGTILGVVLNRKKYYIPDVIYRRI